jgi:hypothetical protein
VTDAVAGLRSLGRRWRELFADVPDDELRRRPAPKVWSPLEYAAHTRDVIALNRWGMEQVLHTDGFELPSVPDEPEGADHGYNAQDPQTVLRQLAEEAEHAALAAEDARAGAWGHTARLGSLELTADFFPKHMVHDATHHLKDVARQLREGS